jgi:ubiquinone/menaquinone biosynthesis C-methylase UbiE
MTDTIVDKVGALGRTAGLRLDLGCGVTKRGVEYVGVDALDAPAVDVVGDVTEVLRALADDSVDEIYCSHLLEHVEDLSSLVREVERVLALGGRLVAVVPHFSNAYYYSDPTHRRPFGLYTFSYFAEDPILRRRVPTYGHSPRLRLERAHFNFRSSTEFRKRYRIKASLGRLVNRSTWLQEFYEENLTGVFPCYELEFELVKVS